MPGQPPLMVLNWAFGGSVQVPSFGLRFPDSGRCPGQEDLEEMFLTAVA